MKQDNRRKYLSPNAKRVLVALENNKGEWLRGWMIALKASIPRGSDSKGYGAFRRVNTAVHELIMNGWRIATSVSKGYKLGATSKELEATAQRHIRAAKTSLAVAKMVNKEAYESFQRELGLMIEVSLDVCNGCPYCQMDCWDKEVVAPYSCHAVRPSRSLIRESMQKPMPAPDWCPLREGPVVVVAKGESHGKV